MAEQNWRVLIVDDEPPIRAELNYLLKQDARVGQVEEAGGATAAVEKILSFRPDVLFLDIQMPGTSGVQLADNLHNLKHPPAIVFVTAFSEYAAEAFELDATDYVLKPVEQARLEKALDKVEATIAARKPASTDEPVRRIQGERNGKHSYIPVSEIAYIEARADYATAYTQAGGYLVNDSISVLERRLASEGFLRVHRSFLVNIDDVRDIEVLKPSGLIQLTLEHAATRIPVSRRRAPGVKKQLGLA